MGFRSEPIRRADGAFGLLARIGASQARSVQGRPVRLQRLFPMENALQPVTIQPSIASIEGMRAHLASMPLAPMLALRFAFHDMADIVVIGPHEQGVFAHSGGVDLGAANLKSGAIDLNSLYGNRAITGDLSRFMVRFIRSSWDSAKIGVNTGTPYPPMGGDVLRLHQIVNGEGAVLNECFFEQLPDHLKRDFLEDGELKLNRAMILEQRNDASVVMSQFHFALQRFHNALVDRHDREHGPKTDRANLFRCAAEATTKVFQRALLDDVLPALCDAKILHICCKRTRRRPAIYVEGLLLMSLLFDAYPWPRISKKSGKGMPLDAFNSTRVPTRLSEHCIIDWNRVRVHSLPGTVVERTEYLQWLWDAFCPLALSSAEAALGYARLGHMSVGTGKTELMTYVLDEAMQSPERGRLGPLGSFIVAETVLSAMIVRNERDWECAERSQDQNNALWSLLTLEGLRE